MAQISGVRRDVYAAHLWEYPWFAAWDLAFQCVALVHVDPAFAKYQLSLLCREWFQHPNGALPSYEWNFSDLNPPVQAWAALEVFAIDGGRDLDFLSRIFDKLLVNFTWWVNREDADSTNLFEGGFLGLDNIGPLNRSELPFRGILEQSDATGWMATYALAMAQIAAVLHGTRHRPALDLVQKFVEHFASIADALETVGVWDDRDGMFYDRILLPDGTVVPVRVHSMVGMIPLLASAIIDEDVVEQSLVVGKRFADYLRRRGLAQPEGMEAAGVLRVEGGRRRLLLGVTSLDRLRRMLSTLLDPAEFLSPHGLLGNAPDQVVVIPVGQLVASALPDRGPENLRTGECLDQLVLVREVTSPPGVDLPLSSGRFVDRVPVSPRAPVPLW